MFKFVFFIKHHVIGHELGMSNEWILEKIEEKLCFPLNGCFNQISVNNSKIYPNWLEIDIQLCYMMK
jgi:hypothetical protein